MFSDLTTWFIKYFVNVDCFEHIRIFSTSELLLVVLCKLSFRIL